MCPSFTSEQKVGVIEIYTKFQVRPVVRFLQAEGVIQNMIHQRCVNAYGQNIFRQEEVSVWRNKFKYGQTALNINTKKHSGRPRTLHTDENCVIVEGLIREDQRVNVRGISEVTGSARGTAHETISDLNFHKVYAP
jgi:hypothetical protein